jgi:hypothetical protein
VLLVEQVVFDQFELLDGLVPASKLQIGYAEVVAGSGVVGL